MNALFLLLSTVSAGAQPAPAPIVAAPAPAHVVAAPAATISGHVGSACDCGCAVDCCEPACKPSLLSRLRGRFHRSKDCCEPACDTCGTTAVAAPVAGCTNCKPAGVLAPAAPGAPVALPSALPTAPAQVMPSAPAAPLTQPAAPEQIKKGPKEDGKGAFLNGIPSLTPTGARVETDAKNPF